MTKEQLREKALALGIAKSEINKCTNKAQIEELIAKVESSKPVTDTSDDDAAVLLGGGPTTAAGPVPSEVASVPGADVETDSRHIQPTDVPTSLEPSAAEATPVEPEKKEIGFHPVTGKPVYHVVD
jgi:hypothetical protein